MDLHIREQLQDLAERLHLHHSETGDERAGEVGGRVRDALDEERHEGLSERLYSEAIDFETDHPDLARAIRRVANMLSSAGL